MPHFDFTQRREWLVGRLRQPGQAACAVLICHPIDIAYLTGVHEGISWLAVWEGGGFAITHHMLLREVEAEIGDFELLLPSERSTDRVSLEGFLVSELTRCGIRQAVVDPPRMSASGYKALEERATSAGLEIRDEPSIVSRLRQCKDKEEHQAILRCVGIAEQAFSELIAAGSTGLLGRTEREIARELESRMIALGADRQGFPGTGIIVASGPNSASNHHRPGDRKVAKGDALLIDWGAELDGYRSDTTRTLFLESIPEFAWTAYPVVLAALERAADTLHAGTSMGTVDAAARDTVMAAGFPEFHYGIGHGIGLEIHEAPWLRAHSEDVLQPGMITTVEPGIYLDDVGGIRIESIYRVAEYGPERLDSLPRSLDSMILRPPAV